MNETLIKDNFLLINNFLEKENADRLANSFRDFANQQQLTADSQVPGSQAYYNYRPFLKLLIEKIKTMNDIVGVKLLPTCAYSRVYKKGNILNPHLDRPSCEISITINLSGTDPWPFYIMTPQGEEKEINLNQGDGVIYLGHAAKHWRNEFQGDEYIQVFLHYVNSAGPFVENAYELNNWINGHIL